MAELWDSPQAAEGAAHRGGGIAVNEYCTAHQCAPHSQPGEAQ